MDFQVVLIFILSLLAVNLLVVGLYIILVLREFREMMRKVNETMSEVKNTAVNVAGPLTLIGGVATGILQGVKVLKHIKGEDDEEVTDIT